MSLENRIIKFCLNRDFFEENRKRISKNNFTNGLAEVYTVIGDTYKKHNNIQKCITWCINNNIPYNKNYQSNNIFLGERTKSY